mgnify:CR=1 FL=1
MLRGRSFMAFSPSGRCLSDHLLVALGNSEFDKSVKSRPYAKRARMRHPPFYSLIIHHVVYALGHQVHPYKTYNALRAGHG